MVGVEVNRTRIIGRYDELGLGVMSYMVERAWKSVGIRPPPHLMKRGAAQGASVRGRNGRVSLHLKGMIPVTTSS